MEMFYAITLSLLTTWELHDVMTMEYDTVCI